MLSYLIAVAVAALITLGFTLYNYLAVKKMKEGSERMSEIALAIREGAEAFVKYEMKVIAIVVAIIGVLFAVLLNWYVGVAFVLGAVMSELAGFVGMKVATYANVRVSNRANETRDLGKTLKVAFRGGSVMGLCVAGFGILGLLICFFVFGLGMGQTNPENIVSTPGLILKSVEYIPFAMTITGYSLGCSVVALFNRVGGGIYTKAADMGADLVGKTEAHIPEDDPRNPATIADNVGDNVGDVAGLGSDLLESYISAIISAVVISCSYYTKDPATGLYRISADLLSKLITYPVIFCGIGLVACIISIAVVLLSKGGKDAHKTLNFALWLSAGLVVVGGGVFTWFYFKGTEFASVIHFKAGALSPWIAAIIGVVAGIVIGLFAEYYTSDKYKPTKDVAKDSTEGVALTITGGMALGMKSCMLPLILIAAAIIGAYEVSGEFGVAMAAIGMLSFVGTTVSVDAYGPIADNAGGIAQMAGLDEGVREITDNLDSVGNTTAAIGKGFAIGSAALAALSLLISFLKVYNINSEDLSLNIINHWTLGGALIGGALPFLFSGMLINAVKKSAGHMVEEVRRQFNENPGILTGEVRPDYTKCISISVAGAISEMKLPVVIAVLVPLVSGFLFGAEFVGGILIGSTLSAIMLAIYTANAGGAWDNAKKYIETGALGEGNGKGSPAHDAAVVGDTVGDPLKDTVGPSLNILIKIMASISLIAVSIFSKYNLLMLLK